jgi:hypothetical protein
MREFFRIARQGQSDAAQRHTLDFAVGCGRHQRTNTGIILIVRW